MTTFDTVRCNTLPASSLNHQTTNGLTQGPYYIADTIQGNLDQFSKLTKLMSELTQKIAAIHDEASIAMLSTAETFTKRLAEMKSKDCKHGKFVDFLQDMIRQVEVDGKTLQTMSNRLQESVIASIEHDLKEKKTLWKTCFQYMHSYKENIRKREEEMFRSHKEYNDASAKVKASSDPKLLAYAYNAHNTFVLQSSSVQSLNNLMSTHVLEQINNVINENQEDLTAAMQKHLKLFYTTQKLALMKVVKNVEKRNEAVEGLDLVSDVKQFINESSTKTGFQETKLVKSTNSFRRSFYMERSISLHEPTREMLTSNEYTRPNLVRTIVSIKHQSKEIMESITSMTCESEHEKNCLKKLDHTLALCDKQVITLALRKQLELFTPAVLDTIGCTLEDINLEKTSQLSPNNKTHQKAHLYNDARLVKPQPCSYCNKWMTVITRGLTCETCKITVHKKCVMKVPFCEGDTRKQTLPRQGRGSIFKTLNNNNIYSSQRKWDRYFTPTTEDCTDHQNTTTVDEKETYKEPSIYADSSSIYMSSNIHTTSKQSSGDEDESPNEEMYFNASVVDELENTLCMKSPSKVTEEDEISFKSSGDPEPYAKANIYLSPLEMFNAEMKANMEKTTAVDHPPVYARVSSQTNVSRSINSKDNWRRHSMPEFPSDLQLKLQEICFEEDSKDEVIYQPPSGSPPVATKPKVAKVTASKTISSHEKDDTFYTNYPITETKSLNNKTPPKKPPRMLEIPTKYECMFPAIPGRNPSRAKSTPSNSVAPFVPITTRRSASWDSILNEKLDSASPYTLYKDNIGYCVALYDFNPAHDGGLQLQASTKIELLEKSNGDWWKGRFKNQIGYFPSKYVLEIAENDVILRVLYDFDKQRDNELTVTTGQVLVMRKKTNNWFEVTSCTGSGLVPASYVEFAERRYMKIGPMYFKDF